MKKIILIALISIVASVLVAQNVTVSGINEAQYIYKSAADSLNQYFQDKFKFLLQYNDFRFGMTYVAEMPKYKKFEPLAELDSSDLYSQWEERYVEFNTGEYMAKAGNFDALIGSGMILHAFYNSDLDEDYRLDGFYGRVTKENWSIQAFHGLLPTDNESFADIDDVVNGVDLEISPITPLTLGFATMANQEYQGADNYKYSIREVLSGRMGFYHDLFELNAEYAESKKYHNEFGGTKYGNAFYSDINIYAGKFTFTGAYKNYDKFVHRLNELPTVNHSEEPLVDYGYDVGFGEEGFMTVVRFVPNFENELVINFANGWSKDDKIEQIDIHSEFRHDFENLTLIAEYSHLENSWEIDNVNFWALEMNPKISVDFMIGDMPTMLKAAYKIEKHEEFTHFADETISYEPMLQADIGIKQFAISLMASYQYNDEEDFNANTPKIGAEIVAPLWNHTELKVFAGSEKGGIVCRNGVCNYQAPFEGARIDLTTRF